MSDIAYVTRFLCGCVKQIVMIDDTDPRDIAHHADVLAAYNSGASGATRMTAAEARAMRMKCREHKASPEPV